MPLVAEGPAPGAVLCAAVGPGRIRGEPAVSIWATRGADAVDCAAPVVPTVPAARATLAGAVPLRLGTTADAVDATRGASAVGSAAPAVPAVLAAHRAPAGGVPLRLSTTAVLFRGGQGRRCGRLGGTRGARCARGACAVCGRSAAAPHHHGEAHADGSGLRRLEVLDSRELLELHRWWRSR